MFSLPTPSFQHEDPNAPIELLLNAIRNSPSPLSAESDHYSHADPDSVHHSAIHSPHADQDASHYPPHTEGLLGDEMMPRPPVDDHTSYHAVPEQSDMQEFGDKYMDGHHAHGASQDETGEYVIEEAYPDPVMHHDEAYRPVPLRPESHDDYLHPHALDAVAEASSTYVPADKEPAAGQQAVVDGVDGVDGDETGLADTLPHEQEITPHVVGSNPVTTGRRRTARTTSTTHPTELERALQTFAVPQPRQEQEREKEVYPSQRTGNALTVVGGGEAGPSSRPPPPLAPFPQVVPQKRKSRPEPSPDSNRTTRASEPLSLGRTSSATLQASIASHPHRRATTPPFLEEMRRTKISRMFAATTGPGGSRIPEQQMSFSTITLLHGHIVQKSYLKEKRCVLGGFPRCVANPRS